MNAPSVVPPAGWNIDHLGEKAATFTHQRKALEVSIRAVYRGSRVRKPNQEPTHYVVELHQDWLARGTLGGKQTGAKVETWDEALTVAQEFMEEFETNRRDIPSRRVDATLRAADDGTQASELLTTMVATKSLAEVAGYSDDLLIRLISDQTNGQYQGIVHHTVSGWEIVSDKTDEGLEKSGIDAVIDALSTDSSEINRLLNIEIPVTKLVHHGAFTIYRFIYGPEKSTSVVVPRGTRVRSPVFEQSVAEVLNKKWNVDSTGP